MVNISGVMKIIKKLSVKSNVIKMNIISKPKMKITNNVLMKNMLAQLAVITLITRMLKKEYVELIVVLTNNGSIKINMIKMLGTVFNIVMKIIYGLNIELKIYSLLREYLFVILKMKIFHVLQIIINKVNNMNLSRI